MNTVVLDWLAENALRAYPVKDSSLKRDGSFTLEDNVILDAQFCFDAEAPSNFKLTQIIATETHVTFTFSNGLNFVAVKENYDTLKPIYLRDSSGSLLVLGAGVKNISPGTYNLQVDFEQATIYEFAAEWLGVTGLTVDGQELTGDINFIEGYQFDINITNNNINLGVGKLFGTPTACQTFATTNDCSDIVSFINGAVPDGNKVIHIQAGPGMVVWDDPPNHRIYVGFSFTSIEDICPDIPPYPVLA